MGFETDLANRLDEAAQEKRRKREEGRAKTIQRKTQKDTSNSRVSRSKRRESALNILREDSRVSGAQLGLRLGVSKRTGQMILNEMEQAGVIHRNGEGWKVN